LRHIFCSLALPITVTHGKALPPRYFKARFAFGPSERGHHQ
jgi:hypothetical protein